MRTRGDHAQPDPGAFGDAAYVPPAPSGPTGPAVVGAAYASVRGTVKSYTKNAITILEKSGRERQVALAPRALVERPLAPKAPLKSKFSQAQSPGA